MKQGMEESRPHTLSPCQPPFLNPSEALNGIVLVHPRALASAPSCCCCGIVTTVTITTTPSNASAANPLGCKVFYLSWFPGQGLDLLDVAEEVVI
jgi:hypothetical protein